MTIDLVNRHYQKQRVGGSGCVPGGALCARGECVESCAGGVWLCARGVSGCVIGGV